MVDNATSRIYTGKASEVEQLVMAMPEAMPTEK